MKYIPQTSVMYLADSRDAERIARALRRAGIRVVRREHRLAIDAPAWRVEQVLRPYFIRTGRLPRYIIG